MLGLELSVFLTYAGAVMLIFLLGKILLWPLKLIGKLVLSSIAGGLLLLVLNAAAGIFGFFLIPVNLLTALVVGVLGLPGLILLLLIFLF